MKHASNIDRRTFLKGTGVTLALPFMDSLASAANAKAAKPPVRLAFMYMPHGVIMDQFWPKDQEAPGKMLPRDERLRMVAANGTEIKSVGRKVVKFQGEEEKQDFRWRP